MSKRLLHYLSAGLYGGLLLVLIEAIDRYKVLAQHFSSGKELVSFFCSLAFIPAGNLILGMLVAAICTLGAWVSTRRLIEGTVPGWAGRPVASLAIATPLFLLMVFVPAFSSGFRQVLTNLGNREEMWAPAASHWVLLLLAGIYLTFFMVAWLDSESFEKFCARRNLAIAACVLLLVVTIGFYWIDSRLFVGRYLYSFHYPSTICAVAASFIFGIIVARRLKGRTALFALLASVTLIAVTVAIFSFDSYQTVKALFWGRGVIAKKYISVAQYVIDLDRDGFSPFLGGGDCDDLNRERNPLAREISGNGIDDNCMGGDLKTAPKDFAELNQRPLPENPAKNVLFITIDCLRADHLGSYGYHRKLSPNIDRFAAGSLLFENAYSLGTNTGHSFSAIARSGYGEGLFNEEVPTVAELLVASGRSTAAITSPKTENWLGNERWDSYKKVMYKGVQTFVHQEEKNWNAVKLTDKTIAYLQSIQENPFYVWVHYTDLHAKKQNYVRKGKLDLGNRPIDIYDSNINYTDKHLGRLFDYLETAGLLKNTIVAISADHGEAFMEHGQQLHNGRLHREQTHVPLILSYPGAKPMRVREPVGLVDLGPTFLRGAGLLPPREYVGVDLMQVIAGSAAGRHIFLETPRNVPGGDFFSWAVVQEEWKLIYDQVGNTYELYNQETDPEERHNLVDELPDRARVMSAELGWWLDYQSQHKNYRYWARF